MKDIQKLIEDLRNKLKQKEELQGEIEQLRKAIDTAAKGISTSELLLDLLGTAKPAAPAKSSKSPVGANDGGEKRTRTTLTPEIRARVKELVQQTDMTGDDIAEAVGISLPSVNKIKKEFNLTKGRKKKTQSDTPPQTPPPSEAAPSA